MKQIGLVLLILCCWTGAWAQKIQEKNVPVILKNAMQQAFSAAQRIAWEKEKDRYECNFILANESCSATWTEKGDLLESEITIPQTQLPKNALDYLTKQYPGQKVKEAARITDAKGIVTYEAEVKGKDLIFDSAGNFVTILTKKD